MDSPASVRSAWRDFDYALSERRGKLRVTVLEDDEGLPIQPGVAIRKTSHSKRLTVEIVRISNRKNDKGAFLSRTETHELDFPGAPGDAFYLAFASSWQETGEPLRVMWR